MLAEHWTTEDGKVHTLAPSGRMNRDVVLADTPRKCCTIEGETWEDCLRAYHVHMGWGPWPPPAEPTGRAASRGCEEGA